MAYTSKYYDPVAAHEYYENYTKKGLLKGRKKGSSKNTNGMSTSGWSDAQKAQWKAAKARIASSRSSALKNVTTNTSSQLVGVSQGLSSQAKRIAEASKSVSGSCLTSRERRSLLKVLRQESRRII